MNSSVFNILKESEGLKLTSYKDVAGVWTIGIGATFYANGERVKSGQTITEVEAKNLCAYHFELFKKQVKNVVTRVLNSNQLDALSLFTFNLGIARLQTSGLLRKVNTNPNDLEIKNEFLKWVYSGKKKFSNLEKRRNLEVSLYFKKSIVNKNILIILGVFFYSILSIII